VHLVEREPSIGGHMAQLDKTFPTNDCSMCILSPKMVDVARHPTLPSIPAPKWRKLRAGCGHFRVTIKKHPRYIDESSCTGCGDCILVCPVEVYNRFDAGIGVRKAIYKPHAQAVPDIVIKDPDHCIECGLCYDVCGPGSVKHEDDEEELLYSMLQASCSLPVTRCTMQPRKTQFGHLTLPDVVSRASNWSG
jgi:heterodisulfide reductase subunit A